MKAKRTLAGVLALGVLATAAAVSLQVSAADTAVTLKASDETVAAAGDTFTVEVSLEDIPSTKVNTLDFAITYDTSILTVSSVEIGDAANTDTSSDETAADAPVFNYNIGDGEIAITWTTGLSSDAWISTDGVILTVTGTVNAGVADGTTTPIDFAAVERETYDGSGVTNTQLIVGYIYGSDSVKYEVNTSSGSVTIGTASTNATTTTTTSGSAATASTTTATAVEGTTSAGATMYGDVNLDGEINMADVVLLSKRAATLVDFNGTQSANGDCNLDGAISSTDASILLKFQVQIINNLPYTG